MVDFLESYLSVPSSHIRVLKGSEATRQNILNAFQQHLTANPEIKDGDPMVFFFAGHGQHTPAPKGWTTDDGMVESICPWDQTLVDEKGRNPVYGIPDRTVWALFHELAHLKGNNITAILDCCHSGSISRVCWPQAHLSLLLLFYLTFYTPLQEQGAPRRLTNPVPIPFEQDEDIWGKFFPRDFKAHIPSGFRFGNMSSHVLLAACRQVSELTLSSVVAISRQRLRMN